MKNYVCLYQAIARTLQAIRNCEKSGNTDWRAKHCETLRAMESNLPRGSGFDSGCTVDLEKSGADRVVIRAPFHHMDSNGYYSGWGYYSVIVSPCLSFGFSLRITGRDRDGFKEFAADTFHWSLSQSVDQFTGKTELLKSPQSE